MQFFEAAILKHYDPNQLLKKHDDHDTKIRHEH